MELDEESDGKIRRNLVVVSTLVLLLSWLEIPLPTIAEKVLSSTNIVQLRPIKAWSAALLLLLYFALRYRFSGEWELFAKSYSGEAWHKRNQYIQQLIAKHLKAFHKGKTEAPIFLGALNAALIEENLEMLKHSDKTSLHRPLGHPVELRSKGTQWAGDVSVTYNWPLDDPRMASSGGSLPYNVDGWNKWLITVKSHLVTALYSKSSVRYLIPCALAVAAFLTVAINLLHSFLAVV